MPTTKNAEALTAGDHLANCSSRVQTVTVSNGEVIITFSHTWARPLTRKVGEKVTLA